jgi:hypothetical protein
LVQAAPNELDDLYNQTMRIWEFCHFENRSASAIVGSGGTPWRR